MHEINPLSLKITEVKCSPTHWALGLRTPPPPRQTTSLCFDPGLRRLVVREKQCEKDSSKGQSLYRLSQYALLGDLQSKGAGRLTASSVTDMEFDYLIFPPK
jgi:hypothetical protein